MRAYCAVYIGLIHLLFSLAAEGQIPRTLSYQGVLSDIFGIPKPDGPYVIAFRLYSTAAGGTSIWSEIKTLQVKRGLFSSILGDTVPFADSLKFDRQYWLGIQLASEPELAPRVPLTSVSYSLNAIRADTARFAQNAGSGGTFSLPFSGSGSVDSAVFKVTNTNPGVGSGLHGKASSPGAIGVYGENRQGGYGVYGHGRSSAAPFGGIGVYGGGGLGTDNTSVGVWGSAGYFGVRGVSSGNASGAAGVRGEVDATTGLVYGVIGRTVSSTYLAAGVFGEAAANTDLAPGVYGRGAGTTAGTGVAGFGKTHGVYGWSDSPTGAGGTFFNASGGKALHAQSVGGGLSGPALRAENTNPTGIGIWSTTNSSDANVVITNTGMGSLVRAFSGTGGGNLVFEVLNNGTTVTRILQITGGSDLAEAFECEDESQPEPGTVMVIASEQHGKLTTSIHPYDRRVAGIVSGAGGVLSGLTLRQGEVLDGKALVAIAGRVYCKADAASSPIAPGDLLTTSGTPGHAMKAIDSDQSQGAIIGKAMTSLKEGRGLVLVLVSLQ